MAECRQDRTVLITGAGSGIGRAAAETFARQGRAGGGGRRQSSAARRRRSRAIRRAGGAGGGVRGGREPRASVDALVAAVRQAYGPIHVLVNNAGIALPSMSIVDVEPAAWRRVLDVNLKSMLFCCQAVVPSMIEARGGRIVNTGSTAAKVPRWEIGAYCVSKAAVLHFTRCLAMELAPYGITVNAVGPRATIPNLRQNSGVPEPAGSREARRRRSSSATDDLPHRRATRTPGRGAEPGQPRVTAEDGPLRRGDRGGRRLIDERGADVSPYKLAETWDQIAQAYWSKGDRERAVDTVRAALARYGDTVRGDDLRRTLARFEAEGAKPPAPR